MMVKKLKAEHANFLNDTKIKIYATWPRKLS